MVRFFRQPSSDHTATAQSGVVCRPRRSVLLRALSCFCHTPPAARGWRVARQFSFSPQQSLTTPPGIKFRALLWSNGETVIPLCALSTATLQPLGTVVQAKVELSLEALIPNFTYTRSFLLQCHTPPEPNNDLYPQLPILIDRSAVIQTTPPSLTTGSAAKARTGRRHRAFNKNGKLVYFQPRSRRKTRRPHRIHELSNRRGIHGINRVYGTKTLTKHRVPPPRGTPGASPEADEEYPHPGAL